MNSNTLVQPFLKWAGGKRQLIRDIKKYTPTSFRTFFEPFVGGGAVLFALQPSHAVINDVNRELMNTYGVIRDDVDALIAELSVHQNEREYFYALRELDRTAGFDDISGIARAARVIYLNKTCFNGLFRVNRQGHFNVPFGYYKQPNIVNESVLRAVHAYLVNNRIEMFNTDFEQAVATAGGGDFVYFDPPYDPVSETSSFTSYSKGGFNSREQIRLRKTVDALTERGCKVLVSNSATDYIRDLYAGYRIVTVSATRAINSNSLRRGRVPEVLIMNY